MDFPALVFSGSEECAHLRSQRATKPARVLRWSRASNGDGKDKDNDDA